jgi:nitrate/nitrite transporter NarK
MANISLFYPDRHKGAALGLNAAGGNLGVAITQLLVPLVIIIGVPVATHKLPVHDVKKTILDYKHQAAAVIGIAGAIGALGGFLIQVIFRQASLGVSAAVKAAETPAEKLAIAQAQADWSIPALRVFLGAYLVFAGMTWFFYLRKSFATDKVPSFAQVSV